jgi:DNA repair exonuclease SbcCD ATPase subunit
MGANGQGKCLRGNTLIEVEYCTEHTIQQPIFTVKEVADLYYNQPELVGQLKVLTRFGYKTIEAAGITARNSEVLTFVLESGKSISVSPDHLLFSNDTWVKAKDLRDDFLLTKHGKEKIVEIILEPDKEDLYDLQVADVHEFYANGIVSHNSTMLDALTFSLFGKSFRGINKPQLVNSINERDCLVEVEFTIGTTQYKVRRGIKPNIFEIYRNGSLIDQTASTIDQQKWFEQTVLKMNYRAFTQIVIIGSSNFVPFMQLSPAHRREVIEDLLDIKIFSSMNSIIKEKIKTLKDDIRTLELKKESLKDKVQMQQNFIDELENRGKENIAQRQIKIESLLKESESYMTHNKSLEESIEELSKDLESLQGAAAKLKELGNLKGKISQKVSCITRDHKFFKENTVCPTCTQDIDEEFRLNKISEAEQKAKELHDGYTKLEQAIQAEEDRESRFLTLSRQITKLTNDISQNNTRISSIQRQIKDFESEIQKITEQLENRNTEHEKLRDYEQGLNQTFEDLSSKNELIHYHDFAYLLLKDNGVKSKIIKKYLPLINQQINRYLQMMDFYINFRLNENFEESVESPIHEDFSYSSFSEGEKSRINLSLLFAWREVAKLKNSVSCNLIIFDEVFDSSLDSAGTEDFLKIIRYVIKDANVFVISHKSGLEDKFESVMRIDKKKNFSYIMG